MYEGRLTRVRKQVWLDEEAGKDLGAGRKEKFSPQEVEQMLSNPGGAGQVQGGATEQSLKAKPHTAVGN
jgi:hypothetical protein